MRYRFELIGQGEYLTDDHEEIVESLQSHIEVDRDVQILICIGKHEDSDGNDTP